MGVLSVVTRSGSCNQDPHPGTHTLGSHPRSHTEITPWDPHLGKPCSLLMLLRPTREWCCQGSLNPQGTKAQCVPGF